MNTITIPALDVRRQLGELLERTYYQAQQYRIIRNNKPMARLVGEPFMQAIEQLMESDSALADTIALMLNGEVQETIKTSRDEIQVGKKIPIEEAFK